jgi:hypothetical protein
MASRFFSFVLFFVFAFASRAQETVNLVPNPSFEEFENGCPVNGQELPLNWNSWANTPDSFSTCPEPLTFQDSLFWAPWNGLGGQIPADGESYCGLFAFSPGPSPFIQPSYREFLGAELLEPLEVGTTYYVSFKVSMGFKGYFWPVGASSHLGALFTTQGYNSDFNPLPTPNFAHVYTTEVITDTVNWVMISGQVVADQAYSHLALGVFFDFDILSTLQLFEGPSLGSYYFVDDVCVSKYPDCVYVSVSESVGVAFRLSVYPNPAKGRVRIESDLPIIQCNLYDMSGRRLSSVKANSQVVDLMDLDLATGAYILEILTTDNKTKREKLLIVH